MTSNPGPLKLVIFDCDGVLVDSERLSLTVLRDMLVERGGDITYEETVTRFLGTSMPECVVRAGELLGHPVGDAFLPEFGERTKMAFMHGLKRVPGVTQVLDGLRIPYCVATNGNSAKIEFTLAHTGLRARFNGRVFTAEDVARPKPAPDLFLHAASMLGVWPDVTAVVEDSPAGITAAKAAGMTAIGFAALTAPELLVAAGADHIVYDMDEVASLLAQLCVGAASTAAREG